MEQLKQLEQKLIEKMATKDDVIIIAGQAEIDYQTELKRIMEDNPKLRELQEKSVAAKQMAKDAADEYTQAKAAAVDVLIELDDPDDIKLVDTFGYRREKGVWFLGIGNALVERLADIEAYGLLKVDEKELTKFLKANSTKSDDGYSLPGWLMKQYDNMVGVSEVIKPTISDTKIAKKAAK